MPIAVTSVAQSSLNSLDILFSDEPRNLDPSAETDGLNLENYKLVSDLSPKPRNQLATYQGANTVRLYFDTALPDDDALVLRVFPVANAGGDLSAEVDIAFTTVSAPRQLTPTSIGESRTDLRSQLDGSIGYDETGDLGNHSGWAYRRKRIIRRAVTSIGSIFHLPNYGFGQPLKTLIRESDAARLRSVVRSQVLREPDIIDARVDVTIAAGAGRLTMVIRPTDVNGVLLPEIQLQTG